MRTFRITLSHGSERVTFDGAGARSGSMFHVRRDAIGGLWSSPASKVSLTERETANGASPISDGETLYAARTVVIPFAIQSNYNHTDLIRARTLLGRLIGWHDVRMDVNDDGDDTVLYGYVEAKYSDIPYDHADTGTITLVCPDPRRVSKHASTISMNTSSSSLGGLSFGAAYELAWTGTPNASTSTMSQNGTVVATNLFPYPKPTSKLPIYSMWRAVVSFTGAGMLLTQTSEVSTGNGAFVQIPLSGLTPGVTYHVEADMIPSASVKPPTLLGRKMLMVANKNDVSLVSGDNTVGVGRRSCTFTADGVTTYHLVLFAGDGSGDTSMSVLWKNIIIVSDSDWQAMQALGVDWFSGDSQSPQPNAGLVFPLSFGQTGNAGNTGMIDNNGSYTSMPTITAHGWLDNGLTIHWNTSDGNEGDLSFTGGVGNVPVTINTDTHSAIMGGLDVSYLLGSRDWPRIPAGGSCSFSLLASGGGWVTVQSHDTYM